MVLISHLLTVPICEWVGASPLCLHRHIMGRPLPLHIEDCSSGSAVGIVVQFLQGCW